MDEKLTVSNNFEDCVKVRSKVFVEEQGFDKEMEFDDIDDYAEHIALYSNNKLIGCGRLYETEENIYRLGRIAILKEYRHQGNGKYLLSVLENRAIERGARHIIILGQLSALGFYHKMGYREIGDVIVEDKVPEMYMRKIVNQ
jgi:predicted GNAT family N-acyltransferase